MAIASNNKTCTNSLATLVAIRAAESAGYFTVGSKKYFGDQLVGKRNGQTYRFVKKDAAEAKNSVSIGASDKVQITEKEIPLTLEPWHIAVKTNYVESITDMDWDSEIAEPNGQKLMQAAVRKNIDKDLGKVGTAFVGRGFAPMAQASAHLNAITNEELYGFMDPNVEAILTSNGQSFVPVSAPDMYSKGLVGKFHGVEYRAQRFLPNVAISQEFCDMVMGNTAKSIAPSEVVSYVKGNDGTATINFSCAALTSAVKAPKGAVLWIDGVMATDTIGDATSQEKAWVILESVNIPATSTTWSVKVVDVEMTNGAREICDEDESDMTAAKFADRKVSCPDEGKYFGGIIRANGAYEFETLDKIDAAGADYKKESVMGVTVHENKLVDLENMENITRFDTVILAGVVEPRAQAYFLIK